MKNEVLYPMGPAAREVACSPNWLRMLCDRGDVQCVRDAGGRRLIARSELERFKRDRHQKADYGVAAPARSNDAS